MEDLLIYLLKSAALLSIFFGVYHLLLRNDTSFQANRHFLLLGILTAAVLPSVEITRIVEVPMAMAGDALPASTDSAALPPPSFAINWWEIAGAIYALVTALLLLRFLLQLVSLSRIISGGNVTPENGFRVITTSKKLTPFSFFRTIVINPEMHGEEDLKSILEHEKTHATQWHSADVLLANLTTALLWFNPLSWWYRKTLVQNLEYIADRETVVAVPKEQYQHTLVKLVLSHHQPVLANNFYQSLIKKRIVMLNKKPTPNRSSWKFGSIVPLLLLFMFSFNVKTEAQISSKVSSLSAVITKESKEENLEKLVSFFNNNEIELKFENVQRNSEGDITNIEVFAQNQNIPEEKGWFKLNDPKGISTFQVTVNDGKIAFSDEVAGTSHERMNYLSGIGEHPLFIIGQKEYSSEELEGKIVRITEAPTVLTGEDATKYGSKAKDGVIIVPNGEIKDFSSGLEELDTEGDAKNQYIWITADTKPMVLTASKETKVTHFEFVPDTDDNNTSQNTVRVTASYDPEDPIIYVDGKKMEEKFDSNSIDPDKIATINVEKASESGERSKVLIVTKDFAKKSNQKTETKTRRIIIKKSGDEGSTVEIRGVSGQETPKLDALYVVDGKVMGKDFDLDSIDPEDIESVNVLKGDVATDKYGKKGRKGVIEINLMD